MGDVDKIKSMIQKIGTKGYKDGSSVKKGVLYHTIPFKEFSENRVHKNSSPDEYSWVANDVGDFTHKRVLDIGCANGYFSFNMAMSGAESVIAYEGDSLVYDVNESIRKYKNIDNIKFVNKYFNIDDVRSFNDDEFDIVLMLNVHMWIHKQIGAEKTKILMSELRKKCKTMYFQTSHAKSKGMYKVPELVEKNDIEKYLFDSGFDNVKLLNKNNKWGNRFMFVCN